MAGKTAGKEKWLQIIDVDYSRKTIHKILLSATVRLTMK